MWQSYMQEICLISRKGRWREEDGKKKILEASKEFFSFDHERFFRKVKSPHPLPQLAFIPLLGEVEKEGGVNSDVSFASRMPSLLRPPSFST